MNRIYQGRVSKVEIPAVLSASTGERNKVRCRSFISQLSTNHHQLNHEPHTISSSPGNWAGHG